jgi:DNA-binding transcriptional ArsR family regulator
MDSSVQEPKEDIDSPGSEQQQDLDAVFSIFFEKVSELPPVNKPRSAKDYLQANRNKIIHALSKGYTYSDLAAILNDCGFSISASTLRRYIGAVKGRKGDALKLEANQSTVNEPSELADLPNPTPTTEETQHKLRPRRK